MRGATAAIPGRLRVYDLALLALLAPVPVMSANASTSPSRVPEAARCVLPRSL
jgi:hypothetical protein